MHNSRTNRALAVALSSLLLAVSSQPLTFADQETCAPCAAVQSDSAKESPARTFPQAICAYWRCLLTPKTDQPDEKDGNGSSGQKKNGDVNSLAATGKPEQSNKVPAKEDQANGNKEENPENGAKDGQEKDKEENGKDAVGWYSAHAQATTVTQIHNHFRSPYFGEHSMVPVEHSATSMTGTLFLDARLWELGGQSGELIFNPEIAGGRGLSNVNGVAGFPNGEITRVGAPEPTPYFARLYLRQTCGFGGEQEKVEDGPNQIAGMRDVDRITFTIGKMSSSDIVDDNRYSHDPRTQFLNWSAMFNGAWDYPANVRGYTYGVAIDFNRKDWAIRYGIFAEPKVANGGPIDPQILNANGQVVEWEGRYTLNDHPGKLRLLAYLNHAHMGNYRLAVTEMPVDPDITLTRSYRFKYGFGLNCEQELTKDLGFLGRLGWNDGQSESWAFTEIDHTALLGLVLKGRCWCRPNDQVGLASIVNGLSAAHRNYLAAGGVGFIIGDGRLSYGPEEILEAFYDWEIRKGIHVTADFQEVNHPAYNRDRGPISVAALRVHIEF